MPFSPAFRPRLIDALRGYTKSRWLADVGAGVTVGIVALPLAMAFAIASGLKPEAGLWTAIIAGFLISALGGANTQIGGPAGAFIVIVYGIVERYGVANLLISTACAGVILVLLGLFRLGTLVRFVPVSIVIGFTNGIAVLIALSQVKDWLGLSIDRMPGNFFSQVSTLAQHIGTFNPYAFGLGLACVALLFLWPRLFLKGSPVIRLMEGHTVRRFARVPAPVVALVALSLLAWGLRFPVETIGSRFGGIPQALPVFALPDFSWETVRLLVTPTLTIALLGAIESLLCARVADQLATDPHHKKHDPNQELMAQGIANLAAPLFGGLPATGTIARTVTNIRAGATSPVAGMVHAAALLLVLLLAAPLAVHVPLAALAGILLVVAWNMGDWHEFARLRRFNLTYRTLLLGTFTLTVVADLTVAVEVGLVAACLFFVYRMSQLFTLQRVAGQPLPDGVVAYELYGGLFFGAVGKLEPLPELLPAGTRAVVFEMHRLIMLDTSGVEALRDLHRALARRGVALVLAHVNAQPLSLLERAGLADELGDAGIVPGLADLKSAP